MTATTEPGFYDVAMTETDAPSMLPLEESPWLPLYREAAGWIPPSHAVVDLGCGTGRFLKLLCDRDHYAPLTGIDFSPAALAEAADYLPGTVALVAGDLRSWRPSPRRAGNTLYSCLEVLEHLEDDRQLVRSIPPGHDLILSVPNYESEAHVRCFHDLGDLFARYSDLLTFRRWSLIALGGCKVIHLCHTRRRMESW